MSNVSYKLTNQLQKRIQNYYNSSSVRCYSLSFFYIIETGKEFVFMVLFIKLYSDLVLLIEPTLWDLHLHRLGWHHQLFIFMFNSLILYGLLILLVDWSKELQELFLTTQTQVFQQLPGQFFVNSCYCGLSLLQINYYSSSHHLTDLKKTGSPCHRSRL